MGGQYRYYVKSITVTVRENRDDAGRLTSSSRTSSFCDSQRLSCSEKSTAELSQISEDSSSNNTLDVVNTPSHSSEDTKPTFWRPHDEVSQFWLLRSKNSYSKNGRFRYTTEWPIERIKSELIKYKCRLEREKSIHGFQLVALQEEIIKLDVKIQRLKNRIAKELKERQKQKKFKNDLERLYKSLNEATRRARRERASKKKAAHRLRYLITRDA